MYKRLLNKFVVILNATTIRLLAFSRGGWISIGAIIYIHSGARLEIGRGVRVLHSSVLSILPGGVLVLKDGCILNHGVVIYCANRIEVGSLARIAHYCSIIDHDYDIHAGEGWRDRPKISSPIYIGESAWLGANAVILRGGRVGARSVVGAHTLIKGHIPDDVIAYCHSNSQLTIKKL